MSFSFVKQSLNLFEDDVNDAQTGAKKRKSADPMKQISTKKKGVKKELKKLQNQNWTKNSQNSKKKSSREYHGYQPEEDHTEASVKALKRLEKVKATDPGMSTVIVDHHHRNFSRARRKVEHLDDQHTDKQTDTNTGFTEDDFEKFVQEFDFK